MYFDFVGTFFFFVVMNVKLVYLCLVIVRAAGSTVTLVFALPRLQGSFQTAEAKPNADT